jgi:hypothetical protein
MTTPLIDRYLQTVRRSLSTSRRDDIVRELAEDLHERLGDREATLGRPLTDEEQQAVLEQLGHPFALATRYGPQRHVIGPAIFPIYWTVLKISLGGSVLVNLAIAIALLVGGASPARALGPLAAFPFTIAIIVFGWVTLIFALIDLNLPRLLAGAGFELRGLLDTPATTPAPPRRWAVLAEIIATTIFLGWWLAIPQAPALVLGPGAAFLSLAPVWQQVHLPMAALWLASIVLLWAVLLRPDWARGSVISRLGSDVLGLAIAFVLLRADGLVQLAPHAEATTGALDAIDAINRLGRVVLVLWILAAAWSLLRGVYKLITHRRSNGA